MAHANLIASWQENLTEDELPPQWMWHLDHELTVWFERLDAQRKARFGGEGGTEDDDFDPSEVMTNELARGRR